MPRFNCRGHRRRRVYLWPTRAEAFFYNRMCFVQSQWRRRVMQAMYGRTGSLYRTQGYAGRPERRHLFVRRRRTRRGICKQNKNRGVISTHTHTHKNKSKQVQTKDVVTQEAAAPIRTSTGTYVHNNKGKDRHSGAGHSEWWGRRDFNRQRTATS